MSACYIIVDANSESLPAYEGTAADAQTGEIVELRVHARDRAHAIEQVLAPGVIRGRTLRAVLTMDRVPC